MDQIKHSRKIEASLVMYGVKQIAQLGYHTFTLSVLTSTFHMTKNFLNIVLQKMVNQHKLVRVYRVFDKHNEQTYVDFTNINKIPIGHYVYSQKFHKKFKIYPYGKAGVYYRFTNHYFRQVNPDSKKAHK